MSEANPGIGPADGSRDTERAAVDPATEADPTADGEDEASPAMDYGMKLGLPLALVALAWAFLGPDHILETGRYELPIVASFVEPLSYRFFGYVAGLTFVFALFGGIRCPSVIEEVTDGYVGDLATGLVVPTVGLVLLMAVLGFVFPALFYAATGEFVRGVLILVGVGIVLAIAAAFQALVTIGLLVAAAPLWLPAYVGASVGSAIR